jgi:hypothetical protein
VKFLEFDVFSGNVLYVPPYWWYSIKYDFVEKEDNAEIGTFLVEYNYSSLINNIANIDDIVKYYLQQQNIFAKKTKIYNEEPTEETAPGLQHPGTVTAPAVQNNSS